MVDNRRWEDGPDPKWVVPGTLWSLASTGADVTVKTKPVGNQVVVEVVRSGTLYSFALSALRFPDVKPGDVVVEPGPVSPMAQRCVEGASGAEMHHWGWRAVVRSKTEDEVRAMFAHLVEKPSEAPKPASEFIPTPEETEEFLERLGPPLGLPPKKWCGWCGVAVDDRDSVCDCPYGAFRDELRPLLTYDPTMIRKGVAFVVGAVRGPTDEELAEAVKRINGREVKWTNVPEETPAQKAEQDRIVAEWMAPKNAAFADALARQRRESLRRRIEQQQHITEQTSGPVACRFGWTSW